MEYNKTELAVVIDTSSEASKEDVRALDELELVLIGGGAGEAYFG